MSDSSKATVGRETGIGRQVFEPFEYPGSVGVGYIYATGVAINAETVSIHGRNYEFDTAAAPGSVVAGNIRVDVNADQTADYACDALVAAINADTGGSVYALAWAGNSDVSAGVTLLARTAQTTNYALVEATTNFQVSAALMTGAGMPALHGLHGARYTVTARDVLAWALAGGDEVVIGCAATSLVPFVGVASCFTAGGAVKDLATVIVGLRQVNVGYYAITVEDPGAVLADTDIIAYFLGM